MKSYIFILTLLLSFNLCLAQETVERSRKLTPEVAEKYHVLKNNDTIMHGIYAAYFKKKMIAAGRYDQNKKAGTWTFFNKKSEVIQRFNYDNMTVVYEAPRNPESPITYKVDDTVTTNTKFVKPIRIGGEYYGFLNYINLVVLPNDLQHLIDETATVNMELLVSPGGRLADFKVRITPKGTPYLDDEAVLNVNLKLLKEDDKIFTPAILNGNPVPVTLVIQCHFYKGKRISL